METLSQLRQRAIAEAKKNGHDLSYFLTARSRETHTAICKVCSKSVFISPALNTKVWGTALTHSCKSETMTVEAVVEATMEVECEVVEVKIQCPKCFVFVYALTQHRGDSMCPDCVSFCIESQRFLDRKRSSGEYIKADAPVKKTG